MIENRPFRLRSLPSILSRRYSLGLTASHASHYPTRISEKTFLKSLAPGASPSSRAGRSLVEGMASYAGAAFLGRGFTPIFGDVG